MKKVWVMVSILCAVAVIHAQTLTFSGGAVGGMTVPVMSLKQARFHATLRQQYDFSCGSAALATLLTHHYGWPTTEQAVFEVMLAQGDPEKIRSQGFSLLDMKKYLAQHGFQADGFELPLSSLEQAGLPAIVLITDKGYQHFVVIKGLKDGRILLGDPAGGTRAMTVATFESIWVNKVLFVIHNQRGLARFNQTVDWQYQPSAPLQQAMGAQALGYLVWNKLGPTDF